MSSMPPISPVSARQSSAPVFQAAVFEVGAFDPEVRAVDGGTVCEGEGQAAAAVRDRAFVRGQTGEEVAVRVVRVGVLQRENPLRQVVHIGGVRFDFGLERE